MPSTPVRVWWCPTKKAIRSAVSSSTPMPRSSRLAGSTPSRSWMGPSCFPNFSSAGRMPMSWTTAASSNRRRVASSSPSSMPM